jgi:phage shock protein E
VIVRAAGAARPSDYLCVVLTKSILVIMAVLVVAVLYLKLTAVRVSGAEARDLVEGGALLLDVRSEGEYRDGAIQGSVNIPIQDLATRTDELGEKDREIVVYCQSGGRSAMAKRLLESKGFTKVHDLGGMGRW